MFRTSVRLVAALLVAVGLLIAPVAGKTKQRKETKVSKKKESTKKASKKASSRNTKSRKASKRDDRASTRKASSKSSRRGKNDDDDSRASRRRREQPRPAVARNVSDEEPDEGDEVEEPAGPRPANRLVADIAPGRVIQIQNALIQKGLLVGPASGVYDQATFQAMSTFQARNGWNPNGNPTADSLKALGVPKNSGRSLYTPARVVDATAPPL